MAGNTRGKIKEHLEGVHRNCDWSKFHIERTLILIREHNPKLTEAVGLLAKSLQEVDKFNQNIYAQI